MRHEEHLRSLAKGDELLGTRLRTEFFNLILATRLRDELPGSLALKGGGLMRLVFGGGRFSKDLDFQCSNPDAGRIERGIRRAVKRTERYVDYVERCELTKKKGSEAALTMKVKAICTDGGVLYSKVEISARTYPRDSGPCEGKLHPRIESLYRVTQNRVDHIEPTMAFGEKVLALADPKRVAARDVLDVYLLLQSGISLGITAFAPLATGRGRDPGESLRSAREKLDSEQIRKNFSEEVVRTLLPDEAIDDEFFGRALDTVDQFLCDLEKEYALQGQTAKADV